MHLNMADMSPTELQFIRVYCSRLRVEYDSIRTVMALMTPTECGIKSPVAATKIADGLKKLSVNFDEQLTSIRQKHGLKEKRVPWDEAKFLNELADIFALSFFKIVAYDNVEEAVTPKIVKDGWCSGEPSSWAQQLEDDSPESAYEANVISAIVQFFSSLMPWGQPPHGYKNLKAYEDRDEDYEDDEWYEDD